MRVLGDLFRNAKIRTKIALLATVLTVFMIAGALSSWLSATNSRDGLEEIHEVGFRTLDFAEQLQETVHRIHGDVYRLLGWSYVNIGDDRRDRLMESIGERFDHARVLVERLGESDRLSDRQRTLLDEVRTEIDRYEGPINNILHMVQVDISTATTFTVTADSNYEALLEEVVAFVDDVNADVDTRFAAIANQAENDVQFVGVMFFVSLVIFVALTIIVSRMIGNPVLAMTEIMGRLADGDTNVEIPDRERKDEIGAMARAVEVFRRNRIEAERLSEQQQRDQAEKDATRERTDGLIQTFNNDVESVLEAFRRAYTEIDTSTGKLSGSAQESSQKAATVASAAQEASTNVQTVSSATEQLRSSINEINRQVTRSAEISSSAVDQTAQADEMVQSLASAAQRIGDVVSLINDIASQTNLLALNATIEAARAGDAGKGFAVVASEVKNLANQTASATEDISQQISGVQTATAEAVHVIQQIGSVIGQVNEIASDIASAVNQQDTATQEIAHNVRQAAEGTQEVSNYIEDVRVATERTDSEVRILSDAASQLTEQSNRLEGSVEGFLAGVRGT